MLSLLPSSRRLLTTIAPTTARWGVRTLSEMPPASYLGRTKDKTKYTLDQSEPVYKLGKHRSNALELVEKVPIIKVSGERAMCDGGGGALGHPVEYISLQQPGVVKSCIYCGLKYKRKDTSH